MNHPFENHSETYRSSPSILSSESWHTNVSALVYRGVTRPLVGYDGMELFLWLHPLKTNMEHNHGGLEEMGDL